MFYVVIRGDAQMVIEIASLAANEVVNWEVDMSSFRDIGTKLLDEVKGFSLASGNWEEAYHWGYQD